MFSAPKLAKTMTFTTPSYKESKNLCNRSFDTAQKLFERQTFLVVNKNINADEKKQRTSLTKQSRDEFFLMPVPKMSSVLFENAQSESLMSLEKPNENTVVDPLTKNGRCAVVLPGKVDFALKINKLHPNMSALWSVFGKLVKLRKGKHRFEHILLLRNSTVDGPILQCTFYDFEEKTNTHIQIGNNLRVIGHFQSENHLRVHKVEKTNFNMLSEEENFLHIQNRISFVLLQNQTKDTLHNIKRP